MTFEREVYAVIRDIEALGIGGITENFTGIDEVCTVIFGAVLTSSLAWDISDTFNGLMMIPNLIGVIALSGLVCKITRNYLERQKGLDVAPMLSAFPEENK